MPARRAEKAFTHQTLGRRVVFAAGESPAAVAAEVEALGGARVMLIASDRERELAEPVAAAGGGGATPRSAATSPSGW